MNWETIDWRTLERLRAAFLEGNAGERNYWRSEGDLANYDATFAQRIGWKWDYVCNELKRRGWTPPSGDSLDWGCGSGIAHRAFLDHFGTKGISTLRLWDRSALAMDFASRKAAEKFPSLKIQREGNATASPALLLLSHVLTELNDSQSADLLSIASKAMAIIWLEPGTYEASRRLIEVREKLRASFNIVAPCTHQNICGMLARDNERHWCHHFAPSPPEIFTDRNWAKFASIAGVDLRSLPLSFLVLDRRPAPSLPENAGRIIGRPRIYKAEASLLGCDASGVRNRRLAKRQLPDPFRELKKGEADVLQVWECEHDEIKSTRPL